MHSLVAYTRFSHTLYDTLCQPFAATGHKMYLVWQIVWDMFLRTAASLQPSVTPISKRPRPTPLPGQRLCQRSNATCDGASLIYLHAKAQTCIKNTHTHTLSKVQKQEQHEKLHSQRPFLTPLSVRWASRQLPNEAPIVGEGKGGTARCGLQGGMRHLRVNKKYILNQKSEKFEKKHWKREREKAMGFMRFACVIIPGKIFIFDGNIFIEKSCN